MKYINKLIFEYFYIFRENYHRDSEVLFIISRKHSLFLLLVCIMGILLISSASANDLNETIISEIDSGADEGAIDLVTSENTQEELNIHESIECEELNVGDGSDILVTNYTPNNSENIQASIDNASDGDTVIFDGYYLINATVNVGKQLNFVGINDATIDGNNSVQLFNVSASGVTFKDITFKNANATGRGGAIFGSCKAMNCSFINNYADDGGGAVSGVSCVNCSFVGNSAGSYGGAVYGYSCVNCSFVGNSAGSGGAVYFSNLGSVINCSFVGHTAKYCGGAIYFDENGWISHVGSCSNCSFVNNSAGNYGGAVYFNGRHGSVVNCSFVGNSADFGGAVYDGGSVVNCSFINNYADVDGGAMYGGSCVNCSFVNNSAGNYGGAVYGNGVYCGSCVNCSFIGNSAGSGGAVYMGSVENCSFVNNHAASYGGAIYNGKVIGYYKFINNTATSGNDIFNTTFMNSSSFIDLNSLIKGSNDSDIYLLDNYLNLGDFPHGIEINRSVTIHGNGFIIDADGKSQIFRITNGNVTFKDIIFTNGKSSNYGGAIEGSCTLVNCIFIGNSADRGGAVCFKDWGVAVNCTFVNNFAYDYGGAIYITTSGPTSGHLSIVNCSFINNRADEYGGAIRNWGNELFNLDNSLFVNNSAYYDGGAIFSNGEVNVSFCNFTNCACNREGGAIYSNSMNMDSCIVINCSSGNATSLKAISENGYNITNSAFDVPPADGVEVVLFTVLNVDDLFIVQGQSGYLQAKLSDIRGPLSDKKVTFTVNGVAENRTTNSKGFASFKVSDIFTSLGEYYVNVGFEKDGLNTAVSKSVKVSVIAYRGILNVTKEGEYYGDANLMIKLTDLDGNPISRSNIELKFFNGETVNIATDSNGGYSYKIPFAPGKYNVTARVSNDYVDVNEVEMNFEVKRLDGEIQLTLSNNNRTVNVKLVNPENGDVYRNVKVDLEFSNGEVDSVKTNSLGIATYNIPFEKGTYSLKAIVSGNYKDFSSSELIDFVINSEYDPNMGNVIYNKISFGNSIVFDYLKSGSTIWAVVGGTILRENISVDGHPEADIKLIGNMITVSGLDVGSYTLRVASTPEDNFYSDEATVGITVNKVSVMISAPKASVYYNSGKTWSIKLYDGKSKDALSNMKVTVKVYTGSKLYKSFTLTTDAKGIASLKVSTWTVGAHKVVVSFSKDGYTSKTVDSVVTILKTPVVITAPKFSVYLKTAKKWSIKVVDSKTKKAIASTKLTLKVFTGKKYKSYFVKTNSKGIATFATSGLAVGTHKVLVSFSKTGYVSKSVSSSIVVKPIPLTIKADFSYGSGGSTVRATVTNKLTGQPANGISVKLIVYTGSKVTKTYTLVTGNYKTYKGFVGFGTNAFSVGTHKVVIKPVSNMYSGQGTTSLVIKSGAANGGVYYSFVSRGKLTLA